MKIMEGCRMVETIRTICFDLNDEFEVELLIYLESKGEENISSFVKQLIQDDIDGKFDDIPSS